MVKLIVQFSTLELDASVLDSEEEVACSQLIDDSGCFRQ